MEEVGITAQVVEIKKKKDRDGLDVFEVSRKEFGEAGKMKMARSSGGTYSSWDVVLEKLADLNLPTRLLNGAKKQLDEAGFASINMAETPGDVV